MGWTQVGNEGSGRAGRYPYMQDKVDSVLIPTALLQLCHEQIVSRQGRVRSICICSLHVPLSAPSMSDNIDPKRANSV